MFVVFPSIGVFISSLTILRTLDLPAKWIGKLFISLLFTAVFALLMTANFDKCFTILYYLNFVFIIIVVPCLTYLFNTLVPEFISNAPLLRIFIYFLISATITIVIFAILFFMSMSESVYIPNRN
jgi:hypothetical protein